MRRPLTAATLAILLLAAGWWTWWAAARPQLEVGDTVVDFGRVAVSSSRVVALRNRGRATLQILGISTSCGCTTAAVDVTSVPPGRAARLAVTFDPDAHGPEEGPASHVVYVRTNDPRGPEAEVEVRAVVVKRAVQ